VQLQVLGRGCPSECENGAYDPYKCVHRDAYLQGSPSDASMHLNMLECVIDVMLQHEATTEGKGLLWSRWLYFNIGGSRCEHRSCMVIS
jgi:hypothetical protein